MKVVLFYNGGEKDRGGKIVCWMWLLEVKGQGSELCIRRQAGERWRVDGKRGMTKRLVGLGASLLLNYALGLYDKGQLLLSMKFCL